MARSTGKKERQPWEVDFVSIPLSREEIDNCKKWDDNYVLTLKGIDNVLFKGCKVSLSYNVSTSSYICTVTVPTAKDGQQKRCFTSHAPDMLDSMKLTAYKIATVLDEDPYGIYNDRDAEEDWR